MIYFPAWIDTRYLNKVCFPSKKKKKKKKKHDSFSKSMNDVKILKCYIPCMETPDVKWILSKLSERASSAISATWGHCNLNHCEKFLKL